jgi:hypothetical protein
MGYLIFFTSLGEPLPRLFATVTSAVWASINLSVVPHQPRFKNPPVQDHEIVLPLIVAGHVGPG